MDVPDAPGVPLPSLGVVPAADDLLLSSPAIPDKGDAPDPATPAGVLIAGEPAFEVVPGPPAGVLPALVALPGVEEAGLALAKAS